MTNKNELTIDGEVYVRKADIPCPAECRDGMEYVIVRTYSAGVFAGYLKRREGREVELVEARRLWSWEGAASLSQLAVDGTSKPSDCKFPCTVTSVTLTEAIEILPVSAKAQASIREVPIWSQ